MKRIITLKNYVICRSTITATNIFFLRPARHLPRSVISLRSLGDNLENIGYSSMGLRCKIQGILYFLLIRSLNCVKAILYFCD